MAPQECCKSDCAALVHKNMFVCEPVRATAREHLILTLTLRGTGGCVSTTGGQIGPVAAVIRAAAGKW